MRADKRLVAAFACSLALHALLVATLRTGSGGAASGGSGKPLLQAYLQPPVEPPPANHAAPLLPVMPNLSPRQEAEASYLLPGEVDERAHPLRLPVLIYPEQAQQFKIRGYVRLKVYIGSNGHIEAIDVVAAEPQGVFEAAALEAMLKTTYLPARKNGVAVPSQKLVEIKFDPYENSPQQ